MTLQLITEFITIVSQAHEKLSITHQISILPMAAYQLFRVIQKQLLADCNKLKHTEIMVHSSGLHGLGQFRLGQSAFEKLCY